jgi:hypothetical protein
LSWEQILDLAAFVRSWGPLSAPVPPLAEEAPTYSSSIGPLLTEKCGQCHGSAAGLDVTSFEALMAGSDSGPVVVSGEPEESLIVEVQEEEHFANLSAGGLQQLIEWIASGAPES